MGDFKNAEQYCFILEIAPQLLDVFLEVIITFARGILPVEHGLALVFC